MELDSLLTFKLLFFFFDVNDVTIVSQMVVFKLSMLKINGVHFYRTNYAISKEMLFVEQTNERSLPCLTDFV